MGCDLDVHLVLVHVDAQLSLVAVGGHEGLCGGGLGLGDVVAAAAVVVVVGADERAQARGRDVTGEGGVLLLVARVAGGDGEKH